jgi:hypothetical protein
MRTMPLPVSVESWQIECCWEPFRIGEHVRWRLMFVEQGRFKPEPEQQVELSAQAEPFSCGDGERGKADIWAAVGGAILGHGADASRPPDRTVASHRGGASFGVRSLRSECRIGRGGRGTRPRA